MQSQVGKWVEAGWFGEEKPEGMSGLDQDTCHMGDLGWPTWQQSQPTGAHKSWGLMVGTALQV